jgi:hypothetical protein
MFSGHIVSLTRFAQRPLRGIIIVIVDVGEENIEHFDPEISLFILPNELVVKLFIDGG